MKTCGVRKGNKTFWWAVHNIVAHPLSEICWHLRLRKMGEWIHDQTIPVHSDNGRG